MALFGEASRAEQVSYYQSEWSARSLPDFVTKGMESREFAFDHDGNGPSDRYNVFQSPGELGSYIQSRAPYAAYCSVAFYREPRRREGIMRTELAFDVDAKDLAVRSCSCPPGQVCQVCLADAKELVLDYVHCLRTDLALREIYLVYSGRGFHIRVYDPRISMVTSSGRRKILDYVSGGVLPANLFIEHGYSAVFRSRASWILRRIEGEDLAGLRGTIPRSTIKKREDILKALEDQDRLALHRLMGEKTLSALFGYLATLASGLTDAKVTMDEKRIIRLPTTLHSKVSMKCMVVEDPAKFDPMRDAVPEFVRRRGGN